MNRARRKQFNPINAPALARWILITGFLAITGLIYVYLSVQLYHLGDRKKALENERTALIAQNKITHAQIDYLTSRVALQRRLNEHYLKMIPIPDTAIVHMSSVPAWRSADAGRTGLNQQGGR